MCMYMYVKLTTTILITFGHVYNNYGKRTIVIVIAAVHVHVHVCKTNNHYNNHLWACI